MLEMSRSGRNGPGKRDLDMILVDRKAQIQQFQLAIVAVEQVSSGSRVLAGASHVLAQTVESGAFVGIAFRVVAVRAADVLLERSYPVNLIRHLERA